jgi:Flp pilus assembly protein TadD
MPEPRRTRKRLSTREQRDLDTQAAFLEGITRRDPEYAEALQLLGDAYTSLGRQTESLTVDEQLSRLRPEDPSVHYHLACSYAVTGQVDAAVSALDRALDLGFRDFSSLTEEPDLQNLRCHPSFARIRARIRTLNQREP